MKWFLIILGTMAALMVIVALVGATLPRDHVATRTATFKKTPAEVYALVRDFAATPSWRSELKSVELLPPREGRTYFREVSRHGAITYAVLEDRTAQKLVTQIADETLPFGGTWTFDLEPTGAGTRLRITERGEVKNVIFRFMARFLFGYTRTIETYLRDLGRRVGEDVTPQP